MEVASVFSPSHFDAMTAERQQERPRCNYRVARLEGSLQVVMETPIPTCLRFPKRSDPFSFGQALKCRTLRHA